MLLLKRQNHQRKNHRYVHVNYFARIHISLVMTIKPLPPPMEPGSSSEDEVPLQSLKIKIPGGSQTKRKRVVSSSSSEEVCFYARLPFAMLTFPLVATAPIISTP
jgi:hypothetical protein